MFPHFDGSEAVLLSCLIRAHWEVGPPGFAILLGDSGPCPVVGPAVEQGPGTRGGPGRQLLSEDTSPFQS